MSKYIGTPVVSLVTDTVDVTGDITTTDATPEVIIVNDTHEDTDGGREGKVTFKGQQSGGEETTLAQIQASHDGTSDDEKGDLIFRTNDGSDGASPTERLRIDSAGAIIPATLGTNNTHLGEGAAASIASGGNNNTTIGYNAGNAITTGDKNTAVGVSSLTAVTTSGENTGIGYNAGTAITTGNYNTAIGANSLDATTTADHNTAVGYNALTANTTGTGNVAVGVALGANTTANDNTAMGNGALGSNTTGAANTAIGRNALVANTTASNNTMIGKDAALNNTTGSKNTFGGTFAGYNVTTGSDNVALGYGALSSSGGTANTANYSTAIGSQALLRNETADESTAVGYQALDAVTTGVNNTAVGAKAGRAVTTTDRSSFFGNLAGTGTTGRANTFLGCDAGYLVTSGAKNTILGRYNGNQDDLDIRTSDNNIVLSDGSGAQKGAYRSDWNSWAWNSGTDALARHNSGKAVTIATNSTITLTSGELGAALVCVYQTGSGDGGLYFANYRDVTSVQYASGSYSFNNSAGSTGYNVYKSTFSHTMVYENKSGVNRTVTIAIYGARAR